MSHPTLSRWHAVVAQRDLEGLADLLADGVVFHSPVVHSPQRGKMITLGYLSAAFHVFLDSSFHYVREIANDSGAILEFEVELDGIIVNGVDMMTWNDEGRLTDFKVMVRPLKAVNLIHQKMAEILANRAR